MHNNIAVKDKLPRYKCLPLITAIYVTLAQISYVLAYKLVPLKFFLLPAGVIVFPLIYTLLDVVAEVYGYKRARRLLWEGAICGFIFVTAITLLLYLPSENAALYKDALGHIWRIYAGIIVGVTTGSFINLYIFSKWKIRARGRFFIIRSFVSTSIGEAVVTLLTDTIAFLGIMTAHNVKEIIVSIYLYKVIYAFFAAIPALLLVGYLKKEENLDVYDISTNFNPFKMAVDD